MTTATMIELLILKEVDSKIEDHKSRASQDKVVTEKRAKESIKTIREESMIQGLDSF